MKDWSESVTELQQLNIKLVDALNGKKYKEAAEITLRIDQACIEIRCCVNDSTCQ